MDAPAARENIPAAVAQPGWPASLIVTPVRSTLPLLVTVIFQRAVVPAGIVASSVHGPAPPAPQSAATSEEQTCLAIVSACTSARAVSGAVSIGVVPTGEPGGTKRAVTLFTSAVVRLGELQWKVTVWPASTANVPTAVAHAGAAGSFSVAPGMSTVVGLLTWMRQYAVLPAGMRVFSAHGPEPPGPQFAGVLEVHTSFATFRVGSGTENATCWAR